MNTKKVMFVDFLKTGGTTAALVTFIKQISNSHEKINCVIVSHHDSNLEGVGSLDFVKLYLINREVPRLEVGEFINNPFRTTVNYFYTLLFTLKIILFERPDIIHTYHYMWGIYTNIVGYLLNIPVIMYMCDSWELSKLGRFILRFNPATYYIYVSKYTYKLFTKKLKFRKDNSKIVYDCADNKLFLPINNTKIAQKQKSKTKIIVNMSRVTPERNIDIFIDISAILLMKYPKLKFYHWGYRKDISDIQYFKKINERIAELGLQNKLFFKSYSNSQSNLVNFIQNAYLTVLPVEKFTLPNVAIQSMMCGTPVVGLKSGGIPEIIKNTSMGSLVNINSPAAYVNAISKYIDGKKNYTRICNNAILFSLKRFSCDVRFKKIIKIYKEISTQNLNQ